MVRNIRKLSKIPSTCRERYLDLDADCARPFRSRGVFYSGISELRSDYEMGRPERRKTHMLIFTKAGEGYFHTATRTEKLTANTLLAVPIEKAFAFGVEDDHWDILWFYMQPEELWEPLIRAGIQLLETDVLPQLEAAMEGFMAESSPPTRAATLHAELTIYYVLRALGFEQGSTENQEKSRLDDVWREVEASLNHPWQISELADRLNVSASTFQRQVRQHYGTSPRQLIIRMRMEQAKQFLLHTDYPLKVVADRLGYADEFILSNAFKHNTGLSPRDFRKKR